jgi:hypothetical protein
MEILNKVKQFDVKSIMGNEMDGILSYLYNTSIPLIFVIILLIVVTGNFNLFIVLLIIYLIIKLKPKLFQKNNQNNQNNQNNKQK